MSDSASPFGGGGEAGLVGLGISVAFDLASTLVSHLKRSKLPQELVDAAQATVDAILAHKDDTMTKEQWEALRG